MTASASFSMQRTTRLVDATGFEPLLFGWALSEELVQWFRDPAFDAVREAVVRKAATHCHRVWRREMRFPDPETRLQGRWSRAWLESFFRHWMSDALARRSPRLAAQLPQDYNIGKAPSHQSTAKGLYGLSAEEIALVEGREAAALR